MAPPRNRRIAVMGFRSVGKSSLTIQFVENQFVDSYDPTIENTFSKQVKIRGQEYQLDLIDTAGQDEFSIMPQSYCMNIDGYVLVYSVNSPKSFDVVKIIHEKLLDMTGKTHVPMVLVGNKTDLRMESEGIDFRRQNRTSTDVRPCRLKSIPSLQGFKLSLGAYTINGKDYREISTDDGKKLSTNWKAGFVETSAKENQKVVDIFMSIIIEIERAEGNVEEKSSCVLS